MKCIDWDVLAATEPPVALIMQALTDIGADFGNIDRSQRGELDCRHGRV